MLVGAAREIINPDLGHHICGYTADDPNTGVHDDLTVTALYLNDGQREAFLLTFDLVGMTQGTINGIRQAIGRACRIKPACVFLTCTHVHSGPEMVDRHIVDGWRTRR